MRLIDADALGKFMETLMARCMEAGNDKAAADYNFILTVLDNAPTVDDAEVVVRCSDCKMYRYAMGRGMCTRYQMMFDGREFGALPVCENGFCNYGRRKEREK